MKHQFMVVMILLACASQARAQVQPQSTLWPPHDFAEYYSAGRVASEGGNPYDGSALLPIQQAINKRPDQTEATMLWTPPWTIPWYVPLGWCPPAAAQLLWAISQALLLLGGAYLLWAAQTPKLRSRWWWAVPPLVLLGSGSVYWNFGYGQNTGLLLFGLGGFVYFQHTNRPLLAGLIGALTAVKPHLLLLFALWLILEGTSRPGRRVLLGGLLHLLFGSILAITLRPTIFTDFTTALTAPSTPTTTNLADWQLPLLSYHFRWLVDSTTFAWQFLPIGVGGCLLLWLRVAKPELLHHEVALPAVVWASVLLAPYGGWVFDLVVLIVVSLRGFAIAIRSPKKLLLPYAIVGQIVLLRYSATIGWLQEGWWVTPAVGVWWLSIEFFYALEDEN